MSKRTYAGCSFCHEMTDPLERHETPARRYYHLACWKRVHCVGACVMAAQTWETLTKEPFATVLTSLFREITFVARTHIQLSIEDLANDNGTVLGPIKYTEWKASPDGKHVMHGCAHAVALISEGDDK